MNSPAAIALTVAAAALVAFLALAVAHPSAALPLWDLGSMREACASMMGDSVPQTPIPPAGA